MKELGTHDKVETSTIHQAKGAEWRQVFVVGVSDGLLPTHYARNQDDFAEELNLLFVAATRASRGLALFHAPQIIPLSHKRRFNADKLSRFLNHRRVLARLIRPISQG